MRILDPDVVGLASIARRVAAGDTAVLQRFATVAVTEEFCTLRSRQGASRARIADVIRTSMVPCDLSERQSHELARVLLPSSVMVLTGQQVGMMGGPMYTLYKIRSAVAEARRLEAQMSVPVIPVFWLEDNDHDAVEAAALTLPGQDALPQSITPWENDGRRLPVSLRMCDTTLHAAVEAASHQLHGPHEEAARHRVTSAWSAGTLWTDAFLSMLAPYLQRWGVLVVRASEIIRSGMHQPLVLMDAEAHTITTALKQGSARCAELGLTVQAAPADFGFFVIDENVRRRPDPTEPGLVDRAHHEPESFSPSVLTRPLVQDAILPTVMNIVGAAELAYHAQLREAYAACGIIQPIVQLRHSATLVSPKIQRLLAKSETDVAEYFRSWSSIERELASRLTEDMFPDAAAKDHMVGAMLAPYQNAASEIDVTLIPTVAAQRAGIMASLEALEGKIRAAAKRRHAATLDRARTIHASLMPGDVLQERVYPLALWEAQVGIDGLDHVLAVVDGVAAGHHLLLDLPSTHVGS